jgi:hypothetical protein
VKLTRSAAAFGAAARVHPVHHPGGGVLPPGPAADDRWPGGGRGEGMSAGLSADPALARLADAVLIPPFRGERAPRWVLAALEQGLAGVTIFGPNIAGPEQLAALTTELRAAGGQPVLAIDEEGGDVTRIAHLTGSPYPGNAALGAVDDVSLTAAVHQALGRDLAALGISVDLAPSVDVNTAADNPVIGIRSFGSDPDLVARHESPSHRSPSVVRWMTRARVPVDLGLEGVAVQAASACRGEQLTGRAPSTISKLVL